MNIDTLLSWALSRLYLKCNMERYNRIIMLSEDAYCFHSLKFKVLINNALFFPNWKKAGYI